MNPSDRVPFRLERDDAYDGPAKRFLGCSGCKGSYPNSACPVCMTRLARVWDRLEATALIERTREPFLRLALRAVFGMRWGIQRMGAGSLCRTGLHLVSERDMRCIFCRRVR